MQKKICVLSAVFLCSVVIICCIIWTDGPVDLYELSGSKFIFQKMNANQNENSHVTKLNPDRLIDLSNINTYSRRNPQTKFRDVFDLNDELFCKIKPSNPQYDKMMHVLGRLLKNQFPTDCYAETTKFWIDDPSRCCGVGLFSGYRCMTGMFYSALIRNRTLLLQGDWQFGDYDDVICRRNDTNIDTTMACFMLPISNCSVTKVLDHANKTNQSIFEFTPRSTWTFDDYRIMRISGWGWTHSVGGDGDYRREFGVDKQTFCNLAYSFFLRLQPKVSRIVNEIVIDSYKDYIDQYNINNTISMVIRYGDKCHKNKRIFTNGHSEAHCFELDEYIQIIKTIQAMNASNINNVIVTSDTKEIIANLSKYPLKWAKYITNTKDIMQGGGTIDVIKKYLDLETWSWQKKFEILISMLSTLKIQFGGKYFVALDYSSWTGAIISMSKYLQCSPLSQMDLENMNKVWMKLDNQQNIKRIPTLLHGKNETYHWVQWDKYFAPFITGNENVQKINASLKYLHYKWPASVPQWRAPVRREVNVNQNEKDPDQFIDVSNINTYYRRDSKKQYRDVFDFNDELFCNIKPSNPKYDKIMNVINKIFKNQFPTDCNAETSKFWIDDASRCCNVGLFSCLKCLAMMLFSAISQKRTLLLYGDWPYGDYDDVICRRNDTNIDNTMACFMLPISNCSIVQVLDHANKTNQTILEFTANSGVSLKDEANYRIVRASGFRWTHAFAGHGYLREFGIKKNNYFKVAYSFFLRLQPKILRIVNEIVIDSYKDYIDQYNLNNTLSMPVRYGDKCHKNDKIFTNGHSEAYCFELDEYIQVIKTMKKMNVSKINNVIVTSGTKEIIANLSKYPLKWAKYITNTKDIMPGGGNMKVIQKYEKLESVSWQKKFEILISMLSTIKIQFGGKYFVILGYSSWTYGIFSMSQFLDCSPLHRMDLKNMDKTWKKLDNQQNNERIPTMLHGINKSYHLVEWDGYFAPYINENVQKTNASLKYLHYKWPE